MKGDLAPERLETSLPPLLTTKQTAKLCGCGERTLWRWSRSGIAPAPVKIGGGIRAAVRFRRDEYLAWIASLYEVSVGELTGWNGLTSGSIIRPGQQLLLRVTPPATATPEPVTPAPSITPTSSPAAIMTPTPSDRSPTVSVTSETEKLKTQSDSNLGILSLLGILIIAGVIILLWSVRRSNTS